MEDAIVIIGVMDDFPRHALESVNLAANALVESNLIIEGGLQLETIFCSVILVQFSLLNINDFISIFQEDVSTSGIEV